MSKGSKQRPSSISTEELAENWDRIFSKKPKEDPNKELMFILQEKVDAEEALKEALQVL